MWFLDKKFALIGRAARCFLHAVECRARHRLTRRFCRKAFGFELSQLIACTVDNRGRNARELCNLQAVTLIGGPGFDRVHKYNAALVLDCVEMYVDYAVEIIGQACEFEVVCREKRVGIKSLCDIDRGRPGEGEAIESAGTASNLVH